MKIERGLDGYEIIGDNGHALCNVDELETAVLVRDFLDHAELTEDEKQTARAAIHAYDENARTKHEQYEQKRKEHRQKIRKKLR